MPTCPSCAADYAPGARFCSSCGTALDATPVHETRKVVTVLFADLAGSTALGERLDPETLRRVLSRYFEAASACVARHGGTTEKFIGDAVMAVFGIPRSHEDDALRALRAAAELQPALAQLNAELEREHGVQLLLRVGVNTGEVVTGTAERLATGDAVNVAARLEQAAGPGEVLVGEPTVRLARAAIETEPVAAIDAKGKSQPVAAHRLIGVVEGADAFARRLDAPLIGRAAELAALRAAFDAAVAEQRGRLITVFGQPGIGKSRLTQEAAQVLAADAEVLSGRCLPYGEGITYWPITEALRLTDAAGALAEALGDATPEDVAWSVRKLLEERARRRPVVLVVEDLHWAEPALTDLLEHLASWTRDAPVLLLCNARPEFLDERRGWGGEHVPLAPLRRDEAEALVTALCGDTQLSASTRARIEATAEGNPLFVEQLTALAGEGGAEGEVPPTIQALLAARIDALPDGERDLLERASVIGTEFGWEDLAELTADRRRPSGAQLGALVRRELIRPHETAPDSFRFRHVLIRDAAYERTSKQLRAELHERFAVRLGGAGDELEEIVGYHLEQAHRMLRELGVADARSRALAVAAADHLAAGGGRAATRADAVAAARLLRRAMALYGDEDARAQELAPVVGRALFETGELAEAQRVLAAAAHGAEPHAAAAAALELALLQLYHQPGAHTHTVVWEAIDRALPLFDSRGDAAGSARARSAAGMLRFWRGDCTDAAQDLELAARQAQLAHAAAAESDARRYLINVWLFGRTPVEVALAAIQGTEAATQRSAALRVIALAVGGQLMAMGGDIDAGRARAGQASALARELGGGTLMTRMAYHAANVELLGCSPAAAERELRGAIDELRRQGNQGSISTNAPLLVDALLAQGRGEEALEVSDFPHELLIPEDADGQAAVRRARALALAWRGDLDEAERLAREAVAIASATEFLPLEAETWAALGSVLRAAGRDDEAAAATATAVERHRRKGNVAAVALLTNGPLH